MPSEYGPLLRDPLTVHVAGIRFTLPYRPAAVWTAAMAHPETLASVLAEPADRDRMADLVLEHAGAHTELKQESLRLLSEVTGRKWWEAARLLNTSVSPETLGRLVLAGVDAWTRSAGEWCAAVYALHVKGQDEKGRIRFDFSLSIPPADYEDEWDDGGMDPEAAMAAVAQMTGKK
jgi:hypothetical protein